LVGKGREHSVTPGNEGAGGMRNEMTTTGGAVAAPRVPMPSVFCPFPPQIAPTVADVHRYAVQWATRHRLLDSPRARGHYAAAKFANLMARCYPAASLEDLCLATGWLTMLFHLDDFLESALGREPKRMRPALRRLLSALRDAPDGRVAPGALPHDELGRPVCDALTDVWRRTAPRVSPLWQARFLGHIGDYLEGNIWEAANRAAPRVPSVGEYRTMRRHSAATAMFFDLIEPFRSVELPPSVLADATFLALRRAADNAVAWFNDLASWPKEAAAGEVHNLVLVLSHHHRLTVEDAVYQAVVDHDAEVHTFVTLRDQLDATPVGKHPAVQAVVTDIAHWIRGNIDWSQESARYSIETIPTQRAATD
jgi:hypothetical protein